MPLTLRVDGWRRGNGAFEAPRYCGHEDSEVELHRRRSVGEEEAGQELYSELHSSTSQQV